MNIPFQWSREVLAMVCQVLVLVLLIPRDVLSLLTSLDVQVTGFALNLNLEPMVNLVHQLVLHLVLRVRQHVLEKKILTVAKLQKILVR